MDSQHVESLVTRFLEDNDLKAKEELIESFIPSIVTETTFPSFLASNKEFLKSFKTSCLVKIKVKIEVPTIKPQIITVIKNVLIFLFSLNVLLCYLISP